MSETKKFTYYPGCSSQGSGRHLDESLRAIAPDLGLGLEEVGQVRPRIHELECPATGQLERAGVEIVSLRVDPLDVRSGMEVDVNL